MEKEKLFIELLPLRIMIERLSISEKCMLRAWKLKEVSYSNLVVAVKYTF